MLIEAASTPSDPGALTDLFLIEFVKIVMNQALAK